MTQPLARISSMWESARDITIEAAVSASLRFAETLPLLMSSAEITKLLNLRVDRDILHGMKAVIMLVSKGEDVLPYFGDVVKNITSSNTKLRLLILRYLTLYAEVEQDTALLSINTIQKSMTDKDPVTRSTAINAISGINISSIFPIVVLCLKRTAGDSSPHVRAAAALSISSVFGEEELGRSNQKQLFELLVKLLGDSSPFVVSAALKTLRNIRSDVSATKFWLPVHLYYRKLCRSLLQLDEWSQLIAIDLLTDYIRTFVARPKLYFLDGIVVDLSDNAPTSDYETAYDDDIQLFLDSLKKMVLTNSFLVILSITRAITNIASPDSFEKFNLDLVLLRFLSFGPLQTRYFMLQAIRNIVTKHPSIFARHFKRFFVFPDDPEIVAQVKFEILALLADELNAKEIINEIKYIAFNSKEAIAKEAMITLGKCSQLSPDWSTRILKWCMKLITAAKGAILSEILTIMRYLLQKKSELQEDVKTIAKTIYRFSIILFDDSHNLEPAAKASIIWIIGEFTNASDNLISPDVLRKLIKTYAYEENSVRYETLILAAKIVAYDLSRNKYDIQEYFESNINVKMFNHVLHLSKYDRSYDTRDRARMLSILLSGNNNEVKLAALFLQVPKNAPMVNSIENYSRDSSYITYLTSPDWADPATLPPLSVRKDDTSTKKDFKAISSESYQNTGTNLAILSKNVFTPDTPSLHGSKKYQLQSLDEFFGNNSNLEEDDSDEEDEEEEDDDDEEEEEEEEEEEDDEDDENEEEEEDETEESEDDEAAPSGVNLDTVADATSKPDGHHDAGPPGVPE